MERKIVVGDDQVKVYDVSGAKEKKLGAIATNTLSSIFLGGNRAPMGLMTPAIRWVNAAGTAFLVERPPTYMTIAYSHTPEGQADNGALSSYTIPLPWMHYLVGFTDVTLNRLDGMYISCRTEPIRSMDDGISFVPLPNILIDGMTCLGRHFNEDLFTQSQELRAQGTWTASSVAMAAINLFWDGIFNRDIWIYSAHLPNKYRDVETLKVRGFNDRINNKLWLDTYSKLSLEEVLQLTFAAKDTDTVQSLTRIFDDENSNMYESVSDVLLTLMNKDRA